MSNALTPYRPSVSLAQLTTKQSRFVSFYVDMGSRKGGAIDAALLAGYGSGTNRQAAKARASELLSNPNILAALRDEVGKKLSAASAIGANVLIDLAQNATSERVKLSAAVELVDRGFGPVLSRNAMTEPTKPSIEDFLNSIKIVNP